MPSFLPYLRTRKVIFWGTHAVIFHVGRRGGERRRERRERPKDQFVTGREREEKEREREEAAGRRGHPQLATIGR